MKIPTINVKAYAKNNLNRAKKVEASQRNIINIVIFNKWKSYINVFINKNNFPLRINLTNA